MCDLFKRITSKMNCTSPPPPKLTELFFTNSLGNEIENRGLFRFPSITSVITHLQKIPFPFNHQDISGNMSLIIPATWIKEKKTFFKCNNTKYV